MGVPLNSLLLWGTTRLGFIIDFPGHGTCNMVAATHPVLGSSIRPGRSPRPPCSSANVLGGVRPDLAEGTETRRLARMSRVDEAEAHGLVF